MNDYTIVGPLTYSGKPGCTDVRCRRHLLDPTGCSGWHCVYCDQPTSYQGDNCATAGAILGEAKRIHDEPV